MPMEVISREDAQVANLKYYFTGEPCIHGHLSKRRVRDKACYECNRIRSKEWNASNKERAKEIKRQYYENHSDEFKQRARQWGTDNPERLTELQNNWRRSEKGKEQSRNWVANNKEAHASYTKDWKSRNPDKVAEYVGTRRATKLMATPNCQPKQERQEILSFYKEAKRRATETGIKHHVDHIIPLQRNDVRGLHVPWNLQVLTESENAAKGNSLTSLEALAKEHLAWLKDHGL